MTVRRTVAGLLALVRKRRLDAELESEMLAHLELAERDLAASGVPPDEARRIARLRFGGVEQVKEQHRDQRSVRWIEMLLRDFRFGLSLAARNPGFSAAVVAVLALGIGANVAMFCIVDAVLWKPLPFPESDRIVRLWEAPRPGVVNDTTTPDFLDWKRLGTAFEALSAEQSISASLTGSGEPVRLSGKAVTGDYFRVFATGAQIGRPITPADERPEAARVVVLSHQAWQTYFGRDRRILNRRPIIDNEPYQVVGVLPPGVFDRDPTEFWKPLVFTPDKRSRDFHWLIVHGRLREGATIAQAREQMAAIHAALTADRPEPERKSAIVVEPLERLLVGNNLRRSLSVAFGAVALVLLIACANVANLLLSKGAARQKELAIRTALGAARGRLVAQLLTETLVLCLLGGAAGIVLAVTLMNTARSFLAESFPYTADIGVDLRALGFGVAVSLAVALVAGMLPALKTSLGDTSQRLNQTARGFSRGNAGVRRTIVVFEFALSLVLVTGAILLLRTLVKLERIETGVRIDNVITASLDLPLQTYATPQRAALFYREVAQRVAAQPGVSGVGLSSNLPLHWIGNGEAMQIAGVEELVRVRLKRVDPGYFRTLGIPVLAGRGVTSADRGGTQGIVVINEALRARLADAAGMLNPVGQKVRLTKPSYGAAEGGWTAVEIAGVIRSERVASPGQPNPPVAYVPLEQAPVQGVKLLVRTESAPESVAPAIREAVHEIDPNLPLGDIATMQQVRDRTLEGASRPAWVIGVFAALATFLAAVGLYGVLSHTVAQQRREIGIRMALGAKSRDVLSHVLRNALTMIGVGLVAGVTGAFAVTRILKNLLFEVSPLDPLAFTAACAFMVLIGLLAAFVPASRAVHVDPAATLREEG